MDELQVGEGGVSDRRPAARPVEQERIGQASIDWNRFGSAEPANYDLWARRYVHRLLEEGRMDELQSAARTGTALARARLAEVYAEQGRIEELRELSGPQNAGLTRLLTDTLAGPQDGLEVAVAVMKVRLQIREKDARDQLIELLLAQDRIEEAITFLQAHANEYAEWHLLVHLLLVQGRISEVQAMAHDNGRPYARPCIADIFAEQGRIEELRALAAPGRTGLALLLARTLARHGRVDEGIAVMQERVDADEEYARDWLIDLLVEQGRADQAMTVLQGPPYPRRSTSTSTAEFKIARLLDEQGRAEDAIQLLQTDGHGTHIIAALLAGQGRIDEAVWVLDRAMADAKYSSVIEKLAEDQADLLIEHGRIDELRTRAEAGHPAYGVRLAAHLAAHGRTDERRSRHDAGEHSAT